MEYAYNAITVTLTVFTDLNSVFLSSPLNELSLTGIELSGKGALVSQNGRSAPEVSAE